MSKHNKTITIIYDEKCSLCKGCMKWLKLHALYKNAFDFLPCQSEALFKRFPTLKETDCLDSLHVIMPDNTILKGEESLIEIIARLKVYKNVSFLFNIPILRNILFVTYRWITNNRYIISKTIWPLMDP